MISIKKIPFFILLIFVFTQCKTQTEKVNNKVPFQIETKTFQNYHIASQAKRGIKIHLRGTVEGASVYFETIFFRNREIKPNTSFTGKIFDIRADILDPSSYKDNLNMSKNPQGEYGNPIPDRSKSPFDLNDDELVLLYNVNGKQFYHKVSNLRALEDLEIP